MDIVCREQRDDKHHTRQFNIHYPTTDSCSVSQEFFEYAARKSHIFSLALATLLLSGSFITGVVQSFEINKRCMMILLLGLSFCCG